jgi:PAS domain S-box-containing protein
MQRPQSTSVTLNDILITEALSQRSPRQPNWQAENQAMRSLAKQMAQDSQNLMQTLADTALKLCQAGTAGVSLLETTPDGEEIFRWAVLAGTLAHDVGGSTPRNFSPCGVCLDQDTPVLFSHPASYFTYFQEANIPFVEGLVLPLVADRHTLGTIWILSHDEQRQFDAEDVRIMTSLADFTAAALLLQQRQTGELLAVNATLETNVEEHRQAEAQLQALIANLPGGATFVVDRDLRYLLADGEALAIAGFKREDLVGKTIFEVLPPELAASYEPRYRQALAGEPFEHEHQSHDRSYVSRGTPLYSANGEVYAVLVVSYDITDRKRAEQTLTADLRDTQLLHELSTRLVSEDNIQALYQEIMEAAIALTHADAGTVQILDEATQDLLLLATQGFERDLTDHFYRVNASSNTSCGRALVTGDRTFIDFDVPQSEDPDGSMRIHVEAGYLSAQSTSLIARSGRAIGMVSTHWRRHHRPSDRELRFLDLLARQAADLIEQRQVANALHELEEKYRSLFNSMDEAYAVVEVMTDENGEWNDFLFLEVNPAFVAQTGMEYPVGRKATELLGTPNPRWAKVYGQVAATGEPIRFEEGEATLGRVFDLYVFRLGGDGSRRVAVLFTDITDRKRREANLTFLADLMNDFAPLATAEEVMEMAGKRITEHLNLSRYMFVEIFPEAGTCTYLLPSHPPGQLEISGSFVLAEYHTEEEHRLLCAGHSMIVNDVHDGTRTPEQIAAFEVFDIGSLINTPYLSNGRWVFDLGVARSKPSVWREDEIELLRELSARIWLRIERARAEAALRKSEAKYRSLFNSIDEGFAIAEVIYDPSGQAVDILYLEANPAASHLTGVPDFAQRRMREISPDFESYWFEIYDRVARTGVSERTEHYAAPLNRWYDFYVFPIEGAEPGQSRRVALVFRDITDRKREEQRQEFLLKLSDALRPLGDAADIEATACRLLGEHLGVHRVYYPEINEAEGYSTVTSQFLRDGATSMAGTYPLAAFGWSMPFLRRGEPVVVADIYHADCVPPADIAAMEQLQQVSLLAVPLIKNDVVVGALTVSDNRPRPWKEEEIELMRETLERMWAAAQRARAEVALRESEIERVREQAAVEQERQRTETLVELDRTKTLFFTHISHEFRTPLTLLLAPLQDALNDSTHPLDPVHRERLELVYRNSLRLLKLVNTLLDFSRIEAGRMEAVYEPVDLATFTADLASVFRSAIERAGLQLIVDCPPLPEPVFIDREMWEKIVLNLLSNAFKFTFEGVVTVRLRSANSNQAILQIQDTGSGIAPEHLPHLFERFYQVRGTQARTHEGSGIGLALVHELVRLLGGTIEVSSTVGEGTCFTITLTFGTEHLPSVSEAGRDSAHRLQDEGDSPAKTLRKRLPIRTLSSTAMGAATYVEETERWLPEESKGSGGSRGSEELTTNNSLSPPAHILIVDDNADMREYLIRILSEHVQVEAVADGVTALVAATERVPDLILSDIMMPGLDGFELLRALRASPRTREVPIILLSARAGVEAIVVGLEAGADDYLIKPFSAQELVSRVLAHLQMAHLRGAALQEARSTIRSRDEFISVVSHELNTPLVSILGWTRLLRANSPSPTMLTKALDTIERNAMLQAKLVQDLLDISRIAAGKLRLDTEPVELEAVIETAIATVTQMAQTKGIDLNWHKNIANLDAHTANSIVVMGDHDRLGQVICNLLSNAIKFTPSSGSVTIELSVIDDDHSPNISCAQICVTDTGIGIAADFLGHVFERFRQARDSDAAKGMGLGLAIARHLVELHNGTISAQSAGVDQGATFTVKLPLCLSQ